MEKEFLYVGYYRTDDESIILKIGTTNNIERRKREHERHYHKALEHTMPADEFFHYILKIPLSKYNTLRYEDSNKQRWKAENIGEYIRNDRFKLGKNPPNINVKVRKIYELSLPNC